MGKIVMSAFLGVSLLILVTASALGNYVLWAKLGLIEIERQNLEVLVRTNTLKTMSLIDEENVTLRNWLEENVWERPNFKVKVTMYTNDPKYTDSDPFTLADGKRINPDNKYYVGTMRYLAVSRDLHSNYGGLVDFGDYLYLHSAGDYTGFWSVRDLMADTSFARGKDRKPKPPMKILLSVDLLLDYNASPFKLEEIVVFLFKKRELEGLTNGEIQLAGADLRRIGTNK